jgi:hypothetical protein
VVPCVGSTAPDTSLLVIDPGHFHATLVQQQMYPGLSPLARVHAPLGPDLIDYLSRIARYNRRPDPPPIGGSFAAPIQ